MEEHILVEKFRIKEAYCGFNYTFFGYKAAEAQDADEGRDEARLWHTCGTKYKMNGIVVSSTYV